MKVAQVIVKKIFGLFFGIIAFIKRLMCRIRRGRKNSGTILPVVTDHIATASEIQQSVPSNDIELESWDNWGMDEQTSGGMENHTMSSNRNSAMYRGNKAVEPEPEPDIDFFSGMTPQVKMNPKIVIRKKEPANNFGGGLSSRLAMTSEVPVAEGELGSWEDGDNAWGAEAVEDLSWEAEATIKEKRRMERERRSSESQRKRQEKDALKPQRKDSPFSAVKLS